MPKWEERAEDVLQPDGLSAYETGMNFIHAELVELNTILYLAEKILEFPWALLGRKEEIFFHMVMKTFHDSAILIVTRLLSDQGMDPFTLLRFKNRVREWVTPAWSAQFDGHMKAARFDKTINTILAKAKELRNHRIAHTADGFVSGKLKLYRPTISDLHQIRNALHTLFDALAFDVEYAMLPLDYDPRVLHGGPGPHTTDIENLLDSVARNSFWLNMPETHPDRWQHARLRISADELAVLNQYRRRLGMAEV
jgi:hypothetical protein